MCRHDLWHPSIPALDQRVVPVNAELTYLHNCNPPLAFTYSDGSEIAPGPAHIGGSRSWASFEFEVGVLEYSNVTDAQRVAHVWARCRFRGRRRRAH